MKLLKKLVSGESRMRQTRKQSAFAEPPLKGHMAAVVRRFQGHFECGCVWPHADKVVTDECPDHPGSLPVYAEEEIEVTNVEVTTVGLEAR